MLRVGIAGALIRLAAGKDGLLVAALALVGCHAADGAVPMFTVTLSLKSGYDGHLATQGARYTLDLVPAAR